MPHVQAMSRHFHLQVFLISSYTHHDAYCSRTAYPSFSSRTMDERKGSTWKTMLIELCSLPEPGEYELYSSPVDGINDSVGIIAHRFSLDILSVSHIVESESHSHNHPSIICTAVCSLNDSRIEHIGKTLEEENHRPNSNLYCFLDAANKLSVRVNKSNYNEEAIAFRGQNGCLGQRANICS
jgi:hypothetical protein